MISAVRMINRRGGSASWTTSNLADLRGNCHRADLHQLMQAKSVAAIFAAILVKFGKVWDTNFVPHFAISLGEE